ncbi:MAG: immunoglobulin domain-containing protein, partial [Verrucomicrobia bacterium]|nr:immunoglobulin domain-containing protein [Verrucomicrobiota bacterium]
FHPVVVSNAFGSITSSVATLTVFVPPTITSEPQGQNAYRGAMVLLSAGVNGTAPLFQWFKDNVEMPGQTNVSLLFPSVQTNDTGTYSMTASNFAGSVTSSPALLIVQDVDVRFVTVWGNGEMITNAETTFAVSVTNEMATVFANGVIFYTLDDTPPDFYSTPYSGPVTLTKSAILRAVGYSADFLQAGFAGPFTINVIPVYPLNLTNRGGGTVILNPATGPYLSNTVVSLVATPASGWTLLQWLGDLTGNNLSNNLVMNSPKFVEAVFGTTLGTTVAGNGAVYLRPPGGVYPYGTQVKLHAAPGVGSFFSFWGNAGNGTNNPLTVTLTNPAPTVSSVFSPLAAGEYALGVIPEGLGQVAVSPARNTYTNGQSVAITATPDARQKLLGWSGDAGGTNNPLSVTMNQSRTIVANFTRNPRLSVENSFEGMKADGFHLTLSGQYGDRFDIQGSTNLTGWTTIETITNNFGRVQFTDPDAANFSSRFYRAFMQ